MTGFTSLIELHRGCYFGIVLMFLVVSVPVLDRMGLLVGLPILLLGFGEDEEKESTGYENEGRDIECKRPFRMRVVWCHNRHQIWRNKPGSASR